MALRHVQRRAAQSSTMNLSGAASASARSAAYAVPTDAGYVPYDPWLSGVYVGAKRKCACRMACPNGTMGPVAEEEGEGEVGDAVMVAL